MTLRVPPTSYCCVLLFPLLVLASAQLVYPQHPAGKLDKEGSCAIDSPQICVVIRTYWGHSGPKGLKTLFRSLQRQSFQRWEAVLLVLDGKPFEELAQIVEEFGDDRIWTFAEWIGVQYNPLGEHGWASGYHHQLYNLTDEAIRACPTTTEWVVVTNGDNEYASSLFRTLVETPAGEDLVALDFYSRYQRPTGPPCLRFAAYEGHPPCKLNKLQWCHTDLGANVLRWPRLVNEGHRFGALKDKAGGLTAEHFDGIMMMDLMSSGWKARRVEGKCLFEHSPSPQRCAREGGVWDEAQLSPDSPMGGRCIRPAQASALLSTHGAMVQELIVPLSSDGALDAFDGGTPGNSTTIRADAEGQHREYMRFFGPYCAAEVDVEDFEAHLLAQNMDEVDDQRVQWAQQQALSEPRLSGSQRPRPPQPPARGVKVEPSFRRRLPAFT